MKRCASSLVGLVAVVFAGIPSPAHAVFHLMQIEQVIAGVDGDTSVQAIQLRMRAAGQNLTSGSRMRAVDAAGANPVIVENLAVNVANGALGSRVLLATANFASHTSPAAVPDFVLDAPIPASYLAAGCLSFETDSGTTIYWRLCWGGAGYTGPTTGSTANDADGQFAPVYGSPLPSGGATALHFIGAASALSTNNAADYDLTSSAAVFTNNAGNSFTVQTVTGVPIVAAGAELLPGDARAFPNPFTAGTRVELQLARASAAKLVIVDSMGRRIREVGGSLPAGTASLAWDGRDASGAAVPAGVYFYRLEVDDTVRSGQVIRLR